MDNKQRLLLQTKNPPQNQPKPPNLSSKNQVSEQNKNLNESMITTSTSSISVNNKKNIPHTNYKTPKKKNFPIPRPQPYSKNSKNIKKNVKNLEKNTKNNTVNTVIYTKGTVKKNNANAFIYNTNSNLNNNINNNKVYGRSMSQMSIENDTINNNNINGNKKQINNQGVINKKMNIMNEIMNNDINSNNELSYFSNNEDEVNNNIINNTINHYENKIISNNSNVNEIQKKIYSNHRTILKEYDNKFSTGYYSESDQRKEKSAVLNIEEILMTEEKLSAVISCIMNGITCEEECFDWFNSYFNTALSNYIEKYFIKEEYIKVIRVAVNLNVFSLMLCYDISYNQELFNELKFKMNEIMNYNHAILILLVCIFDIYLYYKEMCKLLFINFYRVYIILYYF